MKKSVYLILAISTLFVFANCYYPNGSTSKENIKETREVPEFSGVNLGIAGNVYLKQGSPQEVVLKSDEGDLKNIITMVDGGILKIKVDDWMERINNRVNIYITIPEINDLSVSGSGDIIAENEITTDDIELKVSGSGKIKIGTLNALSINTKISGSGDVYLGGGNMAQEHNLKISGSGNLDAQNLSVNNYDIHISGSGNAKIKAEEKITARISGSGEVYYIGDAVIDAAISGSGKVKSIRD